MPDKDGYEVCQFIKQNPDLRKTPVILMSGIVNRTVAEKAIAVEADELIRKPFQPQELIARVKNLLSPKCAPTASDQATEASEMLGPAPNALSEIFAASVASPAAMHQSASIPSEAKHSTLASPASLRPNGNNSVAEVQKLRFELQRLEMLVKKLQSELQAEREYVASLESHLKAMQKTY